MSSLEYFTSERFIHDDIVEAARAGIPTLYNTWKKQQSIRPFILSWPTQKIIWQGEETERVVAFDAPREAEKLHRFLEEVQKKTMAYALLLWEQKEQAIVGVLESRHGGVSWHIPIQDHGNIAVLGQPEERVNVDRLGLYWH